MLKAKWYLELSCKWFVYSKCSDDWVLLSLLWQCCWAKRSLDHKHAASESSVWLLSLIRSCNSGATSPNAINELFHFEMGVLWNLQSPGGSVGPGKTPKAQVVAGREPGYPGGGLLGSGLCWEALWPSPIAACRKTTSSPFFLKVLLRARAA